MISDINSVYRIPKRYSRIYYGHEFCPNLMFTFEDIKKVYDFCEKNGKDLTLVTSFLPGKSFENMVRILDYLKNNRICCEIVINDWGLLYYIDRNYKHSFSLVLGRLLNKLKKSPNIMNVINKINPESRNVFRFPSSNFIHNWEVLKKYGVERVEFENVLQGNCFERGYPFEKSLVYPYVFITTSRRCVSDFVFQEKDIYELNNCKRQCHKYELELYNKTMLRDVILKGNTYYYKNEKLPANIENYSRLVLQNI